MTGPATGGYERGTGAPSRSTGTQGTVGAILFVLALGLALRLILAYLLPGSGFEADLTSFRFWASDLASNGLYGFYQRDFFHDYTPGYLYVLWLVGTVGNAVGGIGDLIKVPPILADLAIGYLVWSMVRELGGRDRLALLGAAVVVVNPVFWFDSVVWGQVDSVGVVFLLLGLRALWRDQPERAAIFTVVAAIIKPQLGILVPLVAVVTIRRALWPPHPTSGTWEQRTDRPLRILTTGAAGYLTAVVLCVPFGLSVLAPIPEAPFFTSGLIDQIVLAGGGYPYLTVNAYNAWSLVPGDLGISLANGGLWVCDAAGIAAEQCGAGVAVFGAVPAVAVGAALLVATMGLVLWIAARHPDRLTLLVALALLALAFFAVPTRVHERYGFPFFALGAILFAISARWRVAYVVLAMATFANMYVVLTTLYPDNPSIADWLGVGELIRSTAGVTLVAVLHTAAFGWALLQLRRGARARLQDELAHVTAVESPDPIAPAGATGDGAALPATRSLGQGPPTTGRTLDAPTATAAVHVPTWSDRPSFNELGLIGWFRARVVERPIRADRSRSLAREGGGRFDRLDVWLLIVLVVASFGMRVFRLEEPYQMHFDEVYHARTATEFLQAWRYGESHDIYEWTHPHLAKYAMAAGLVLWGEDDVAATSTLGVPVRAVAIEHRRVSIVTGDRAGERLHIATGGAIRTDDLRTRRTVGATPAPDVTALAIDPDADRLVIGFDDGRVETIELDLIGLKGAARPVALAALDHPIEQLMVTADGATVIAASDERLTALDATTGDTLGGADLPGIAALSPAGSGAALVATPASIEDPVALATTLAELIGGEAIDYETRLAEAVPEATVILGAPGGGDTRTAVEDAIADGRLAGVEIVDLPRVAVATSDGVSFIDPSTAAVSSSLAMDGGAHGVTLVTDLDDPKLYVTTGGAGEPGYEIVAVGGDAADDGPVSLGRHPLPGSGTDIVYDAATQQVHVLGRAPASGSDPGVGGWTVYAIEPHANAVFADALLPAGFEPVAWAADIEADQPAEDRQDLLVFAADGATASIELGSHAFAWRLPGVIAGVLMAACLYLLARMLFARRLVAGLVAAFVLLEGMLFVQSRIGMNDVYVGLFIVAAYTLFAAVWTGWWRGRAVVWLSMPVVGLLLGLALASKWVAAYAIGALALLLLARSALGRVVAILGLIGITSVLGYMAIAVPEGEGFGNITFLAIMIGLTLVAVVAAVFHPVAWTDDEMRFAVIAPALLGAMLFFGALAIGRLDEVVAIGPVSVTPLLGALAAATGSLVVYATFRVAAGLGYGPLAGPPAPTDPNRILDAPADPPPGWLRPGWLLGLPLVWATLCLIAIPLAVYVVSYVPWALIDNHRLWDGVPAGHTGQTLLELTGQMYGYHNGLTSPHPASSPWWAWPLDLKPVWFYQDGFAGGTSAAVYGAGNLVIWWVGAVAVAFVSIMAFRRRSLALTLIAVGFAAQWVPWARIDRAAFQYHYYTALPFMVLALAYLVAELWHGPSRRTWLVMRAAGAVAVVAPALLWLLSRPLCALVGVESVNPGSQACPAVIPDMVLTVRTAGLLGVVVVGAVLLGREVLDLQRSGEEGPDVAPTRTLRRIVVTALGVAIGFGAVALLPDSPILTLSRVPVEPIALLVALPLLYLAGQVFAARDARRFVSGLILAAIGWFVIVYPNIAALPLPSTVVNAYQGVLPTYLYAFQFPVSQAERGVPSPFLSPTLAILTIAIGATCLVVAYSASAWRVALAESSAASAGTSSGSSASGDGVDLARTGGGA